MTNPDLSRATAKLFRKYRVPISKGFEWAAQIASSDSEKDLSPELREFLANPYFIDPNPEPK
jgi:hypothetical protein